jgi:L-fuculose-phosphate aldolase
VTVTADESALRQALCDVGRHLYERGHGAPGDGNLSVRLDAGTVLCTPTASHKGRLRPEHIVAVDAVTGVPREPAQRASSELRLHLALYRARPEAGAIVHAHSPYATACSVAGLSLAEPVLPEAVFALSAPDGTVGCPTVPYALPTTEDVPAAVLAHARGALAFVLERHGPVALGRTLDEALARLEVVEHTARITLLAHAAGGARPLPAEAVERLHAMALAAR